MRSKTVEDSNGCAGTGRGNIKQKQRRCVGTLRSLASDMQGARDPDHELHRAFNVIFGVTGPGQKMSKPLRTCFQSILILRAGSEVAGQGAMHAEQKHAMLAEKVQAHKGPLIAQLEELAGKIGMPLPEYVKDAINYSNARKKIFVLAPNAGAWKRYTGAVATMRNHVFPVWRQVCPAKLPSGVALDEVFALFFKGVADIKSIHAGSCFHLTACCPRLLKYAL